jgi:hypothetical protein
MSMQYIRDFYGVPAKRGSRVRYSGSETGPSVGKIVGARQQYLPVKFGHVPRPLILHPTWKIEYLP